MPLNHMLLVGLGGFAGSVLRYLLAGLVQRMVPQAAFPWGTLAVNISGCLVIGLLYGLSDQRQVMGPQMRVFLLLGVLGGFTTFSTFGYEVFALLRDGERFRAATNVLLQVILGVAAVWAGYAAAARLAS